MRILLALLCLFTIHAGEVTATWTSRSGWVVAPGGEDRIGIVLRSSNDWRGVVRLEVCDATGKLLRTLDQDATLNAGKDATVEQTVSFAGRPPGEHLLRWRLLSGPKDDRKQDAGWERSLMVAGPYQAFILLDREPVARGLELIRQNVQPVEITTGGLKRWVWKANFGSAAQGWWRSHRFTVTDPAFQGGAAPVVDVESWSVHRSDAPINLAADNRAGGIAEPGWGGRGTGYNEDPPWKHMMARLDDAVFAGGKTPSKPEDNAAMGCDVRYNACTADGELRSLVLTRYDLTNKPQWARLLRLQGVDCGKDRYIFTPGTRIEAKVKLVNRARVAYRAQAQVSFHDADERELWAKAMPVDIPPGADGALNVPIDTAKLPYGVYVLRTRIGEHLKTETMIGLSDETPLAKAKPGEFLYGTDCGGSWQQPLWLDWADYMGMDIIRNLARNDAEDLSDVDQAVAALKARGLQGAIMMGPAWDADAGKRTERWAKQAEFIGAVAKRHSGFLRWYELGNEPDLTFFYAGPTDHYVEGYLKLHEAIKANDPDSVVMNGGLCFHSEEGWRRAHEIIAKIPADKIDAWAYHGHGPGAQAERDAWNRQDKAVRAVGKGDRPYIETESGLSAGDWPSRRRQAQTIVEKLVFAQSVKAPLFLWFNLRMGGDNGSEWGYTTIEREREPRPAVLAHRAMVKALRGLAHAGTLDLLAPQAEAHLFAGADGRRAVVAWSDRGEITRTLAIGSGCTALRRSDLYGNVTSVVEAAPGFIQLACAADPVFITWKAGDPAFAVALPPPPLVVPDGLRVVPGRPAILPVTVRNPGDGNFVADVATTTIGAAPAKAPPTTPVQVAAGGSQRLDLSVQVAAVAPSAWPRQWTVFAPIEGEIDLSQFKTIPRSVTSKGKELQPIAGIPRALDLDLGKLAGGHGERKQALCFAWLDSDREQEVEFGAGADWWMEWLVNGRPAFSTIDVGNNGPYHVLTHNFKVKLVKGRNLLAVRALSGSGGWRLVAGGPDEVAAARRERMGQQDVIRLDLLVGGRLLARQAVPVEVLRPIERSAAKPDWSSLAPDGEPGAVDNLFIAIPDDSKHYKGRDDLSARIWLRDDGTSLLVAVQVRDDVQMPGDGSTLRLATGAVLGKPTDLAMTARRDEATRTTWYETAIPRTQLGQDRFAMQVQVRDDDWGELKQRAAWGEGDDPERWFQAWLR